MAELGTAHGQP